MTEKIEFIIELSFDSIVKGHDANKMKNELEKKAEQINKKDEFKAEVKEESNNYKFLMVQTSLDVYKKIFETEELPPKELSEEELKLKYRTSQTTKANILHIITNQPNISKDLADKICCIYRQADK